MKRRNPQLATLNTTHIADYDAIEVQALNYTDDDYKQADTLADANTFSVYWHLRIGGVECIGDAATYADATTFAEALSLATGYPINDMTS